MPSKSIFHVNPSNYKRLGQMLTKAQEQNVQIAPKERHSYNIAAYVEKLNSRGHDGDAPTLFPPARAPFQEAVPPGYPIPVQTPMSTYGPHGSYHSPISRISLRGDTNIGPKKTIAKVEAVNAALDSNMNTSDFYRKFGLNKHNANRWLKNAEAWIHVNKPKPISRSTRSTRNGMGGGRKTRNARKKTRKTRKTMKTRK